MASSDKSQEHYLCGADEHSHFHCSHCPFISRFKFAINRHNVKQHRDMSASPSTGGSPYTSATLDCESAVEATSPDVEQPRKKAKYCSIVDDTSITERELCEKLELEGLSDTGHDSSTDQRVVENKSFKTLQSETVNFEAIVEPNIKLDSPPVVSRTDKKLTDENCRSKSKRLSDRLKVSDKTVSAYNKIGKSAADKGLVIKVVIDMNGEERTEKVAPYSGPVVIPKTSPTSKKSPCPLCNQKFVRVDTLRNHLACTHDIIFAGQSWFHCVPCKFVTSYRYLFASHVFSLLHLSVMESCRSSVSTVPLPSEITEESRVRQRRLSVKVTDVSSNIPMSAVNEGSTNVAVSTPTRSMKRQRLLDEKINRIKWFYCGIPSISTASMVIGAVKLRRPQILWNNVQHTCTTKCLPKAKTPVKKNSGKTSARANKPDNSSRTQIHAIKHSDNTGKTPIRVDKQPCRKLVARKSTTRPPNSRPSKEQSIIDVELLSPATIDDGSQPIVVESIDTDVEESCPCSLRIVSVTGTRNDISKQKSNEDDRDDDSSDPEITLVEPGRCPLINQTPATPSASLTSLFSSPQSSSAAAASLSLPLISYLFPNLIPPSCLLVSDSPHSSVTVPPAATEKPAPPISHVETSVAAPPIQSQPSVPVSSLPSVPVGDTSTASSAPGAAVASTLDQFTADDLWCELSRRGRMRSCPCGVNFMDVALYLLHRSCHSSAAPLQCAFCNHNAASCYDFHGHLLDHKK